MKEEIVFRIDDCNFDYVKEIVFLISEDCLMFCFLIIC